MKTLKRLGILLLSTVVLCGCAEETTETTQKGNVIEIQDSITNAPQKVQVTKGNIGITTYYDAYVGPKVQQLKFATGGSFGEYLVQIGDTVKEGDILATPILENIDKSIENKKNEIESITDNYNYNKTSLENDLAIAKKELDIVYEKLETVDYLSPEYSDTCRQAGVYDEQGRKIELQLKQLKETYEWELPYHQKQLKEMQEQRELGIIRAPFDGTIIALANAEYGRGIDTSQYYVAIADTTVNYVRCESVSAATLKQLVKATFRMGNKEYAVTSIAMDNDYYMETMNANEPAYSEFELPASAGDIAYGDYGKLILTTKYKEDVLLLPELAVHYYGGRYYVYKDVDGEHVRTDIKVGIDDGINMEILEGLEEGDVVYVQE